MAVSKAGNPLIDVVTHRWKTADSPQLLRGIYVELRVMNALLAAATGTVSKLEEIRQDMALVYPTADEWS
jgi:hypothetical protein